MRPTYNRLRLLVVFVTLLLMGAASGAAEPVAVFEAKEVLGNDWARTLVNYPIDLPAGRAFPEALRLVDAAGNEQPCQVGQIRRHADGSIATARVSLIAALPKLGRFHYRLLPEKPAPAINAPRIIEAGEYLTLENSQVALRLARTKQQRFQTPLRFGADHVAMVQAYGRQVENGIAPGPIQGIRLADGRWIGGSYFWSADPEQSPKVVVCRTEIVEQGPLFVEARVHYDFDNGGFYEMTARLLADDPAARIDEQLDLKRTGAGFTWRLVVSLSRGWESGGWKPDGVFHFAPTGGLPRDAQLEDALQKAASMPIPKHGGATGCQSLSYDAPFKHFFNVDAWYPYHPAAHYFGLFERGTLAAAGATGKRPFLAVVPVHAGSWRGNQLGFQTNMVFTHKADDVEIQWPLMADPHPNNLLHTGEYDPARTLTFKRRVWALVGGPLQFHGTLFAFRHNEGNVGLDQYKDWILDWPQDPKITYPRLVLTRADVERLKPRLGQIAGTADLQKRLYFADNVARREEVWKNLATGSQWSSPRAQALKYFTGYEEYPWHSHYRQSQFAAWCHDADELLASPSLAPERRHELRTQLAALCYLLAEPDFNPRGSLVHLGNPGMPLNRFFALTFAAALIPDHPRAGHWLDVSEKYVRYKLAMNTAPGGAWSEQLTYLMASMHIMQASVVLDRAGRLEAATAELASMMGRYPLQMITPPDPRFGSRAMPNWGHEGCNLMAVWLLAAGMMRERDPELARALVWAWDQLGRPVWDQHDAGFRHSTIVHSDLLAQIPQLYVPPYLKSVWLPGFGAVLRAHPGDPQETYLAYRQGYLVSHSDANQGDFVLYSKGVPFTTLSAFNYAIANNSQFSKLYKEIGWHNRIRFGSQTNDGGWPGGGPISQVHSHSFGDSVDYLRGLADYGTERWTRQILLLKGQTAAGPNYFVFRDSFQPLDAGKAPAPKWWTLRTLGAKEQVSSTPAELRYTTKEGPTLDVRFLQPAAVAVASRDATQEGVVYGQAAANWRRAHSLPLEPGGDLSLRETMTVSSVGPIAPGQDVFVVLTPRAAAEGSPKIEPLGDGAAKIATTEGVDYVFADRKPMKFQQGDIEFEGIAGAVRVRRNEVHLVLADGPGKLSYRGTVLRSSVPVTRVIRNDELRPPQAIEVPDLKTGITFSLDPALGAIDQLAAGVRRQQRANGYALEFHGEQPFQFNQAGVVFNGRRGGIVLDTTTGATRLVLLDGEKIGAGKPQAWGCAGPYDVTFHSDRITGAAEGLGRFLYVTRPFGLDRLPVLIIDGQTYAPGTYNDTHVLPLLPGACKFEMKALEQPPIFRPGGRSEDRGDTLAPPSSKR